LIFARNAREKISAEIFQFFARVINLRTMQNYSCNCAGILRHCVMAKKKPAKKKAVKAGKKKK
jgi:hypothetical protein